MDDFREMTTIYRASLPDLNKQAIIPARCPVMNTPGSHHLYQVPVMTAIRMDVIQYVFDSCLRNKGKG